MAIENKSAIMLMAFESQSQLKLILLILLFLFTSSQKSKCLLLSESISLQFNILYFQWIGGIFFILFSYVCWGNKCGIKTDDKKMFSKRNVVTVIKLLAFFLKLLYFLFLLHYCLYIVILLMNELNEEIIELAMWLFVYTH